MVAGAIENKRARGSGGPIRTKCNLVKKPHRQRASAAGLEIDVESLSLHVSGAHRQACEQGRPLPDHEVMQLEAAGSHLREIVIQPAGQGCIEIDDVARAVRGKEARRRVIEIVDCVLQLLEYVLMTFELARHIRQRPNRHAGIALSAAEGANPDAQPTPFLPLVRPHAHLLLAAPALTSRFQQPVDRFRYTGIADEHPLDRPRVLGARRSYQANVSAIRINNSAVGIRYHDAVARPVDHGLEERACALSPWCAQDARCERKQEKYAYRGEEG